MEVRKEYTAGIRFPNKKGDLKIQKEKLKLKNIKIKFQD